MYINNLQAVKKNPANKQMEFEIKLSMLCVMLCCYEMFTTRKLNPLSPDLKMNILLTVLHTFLMELVRRSLNIKTSDP